MGKLSMVLMLISMLFSSDGPKDADELYQRLSCSQPDTITVIDNLYFHAKSHGLNTTSVRVASAKTTGPPNFFGLVEILDYPITIGPDINGKHVGQAQGLYTSSSMESFSPSVSLNVIFTSNDMYSESTLAIMGYDPTARQTRDLSVVGGTGEFQLARGIATFTTYSYNLSDSYAIVRLHITIVKPAFGFHHKASL